MKKKLNSVILEAEKFKIKHLEIFFIFSNFFKIFLSRKLIIFEAEKFRFGLKLEIFFFLFLKIF